MEEAHRALNTHGPDSPHRLALALNMAALMSEDHDVLVYIDIKGVDIVLKDSPDISFAHFPSSKTQLALLSGKKVTLAACPGYLRQPDGRRLIWSRA
jgi:predicted peroxiredoxin